MAIAKGITEIPDSEEDSLTSSPQAPPSIVDPPTNQQNSAPGSRVAHREQETTTEDCESPYHVTLSHLPPDKATRDSNHGSMSPLVGHVYCQMQGNSLQFARREFVLSVRLPLQNRLVQSRMIGKLEPKSSLSSHHDQLLLRISSRRP